MALALFVENCLFPFIQVPIIKERRRFTDVMEEESEARKESRLSAWGREDFSVHKLQQGGTLEMQVRNQLLSDKVPWDLFVIYFRRLAKSSTEWCHSSARNPEMWP